MVLAVAMTAQTSSSTQNYCDFKVRSRYAFAVTLPKSTVGTAQMSGPVTCWCRRPDATELQPRTGV